MPQPIRVRVIDRGADEDVMFSAAGMALIFGMPLDATEFPPTAFRDGKRRIREAFAAIGDEDLWRAMEYFAAKDHGAVVEFTYEVQP